MDGREAFAVPGRGTVMRAAIGARDDSTLAHRMTRHRGGIVEVDAFLPNIHRLCMYIGVAHRKKPRPHRCTVGIQDTVSWHEEGARQVYAVMLDYEITIFNKWCRRSIDAQQEIFA